MCQTGGMRARYEDHKPSVIFEDNRRALHSRRPYGCRRAVRTRRTAALIINCRVVEAMGKGYR
jgi:hypothetical protein